MSSRTENSGKAEKMPAPTKPADMKSSKKETQGNSSLGMTLEGRVNVEKKVVVDDKIKILKEQKKPGKNLAVSKIDLHMKNNMKLHFTLEYEQNDLILRRGQKFKLSIIFDRPIDSSHDLVTFQFAFGSCPSESKGTIIRLDLDLKKDSQNWNMSKTWGAVVRDLSKNQLDLEILSPPDAFIGRYVLFVETNLKDAKSEPYRYKYDGTKKAADDDQINVKDKNGEIIMLFNPWNPEDTVYMPDKDQIKEYILNEFGQIWVGSVKDNRGRPWNFGQFSKPCLDAALFLLDKGKLADTARNSAISVIRKMSALANSCDENGGVLEGRWTDDYPKGCTMPWTWTGSVAILKKFMEDPGRHGVQFGQCWVFSGVVTTLLRALGIPTRSVTNFESAHDKDCSNTIDFHFDEDGNPITGMNDAKWNFHVWNESWLRRHDLPDGYDGWQAHDATPQEVSEGVMRCGPASVKAIKEGHVYLNYDVGFVFAEVNGDRIVWKVKDDGSMEVIQIDPFTVGKCISTKKVGVDEREDLTLQYKYPDGSDDERRVVKFVSKFGTRHHHNIYGMVRTADVDITVKSPENTLIGEDFTFCIAVKNISANKEELKVKSTLANAYYTGHSGKLVKEFSKNMSLQPGKEEQVEYTIKGKDYAEKRNPEGRFQLIVNAKTLSSGRMHMEQSIIMLTSPNVKIEAPKEVVYGKESEAVIKFPNKTKIQLTSCVFSVEGGGLCLSQDYPLSHPIEPGAEVSQVVKLRPYRRFFEEQRLVVAFTSDQVINVQNYAFIKVVKPENDEEDEDDMYMDWFTGNFSLFD